MVSRKFLLYVLFLIIACSQPKHVIVEKEKIYVRTESRANDTYKEIYPKEIKKRSDFPQNLRIWIKIEGGEIVDNAILSDVAGSLYFDHTENYRYSTKLFIRSSYYGKTYVFSVPRENGEHMLIGYPK